MSQKKTQRNSFHSKTVMPRARKRFGQNFLVDDTVIDGIIDAAELSGDDVVLEIGPGRGALTERLAREAGRLVAVEIDWDLASILEDKFQEFDNVTIIREDILKLDLDELLGGYKGLKIVANLPYYITTPIIMKLFESGLDFDRIIVMVQKEVALRMCATPGSSDYGALSLAVEFYSNPSIIIEVPAHCFRPVPKVDSAVVRMDSIPHICKEDERANLFKVIKGSFLQRRKTLVNALSSADISTKDRIREAIIKMGLNENIRGEILSLNEFYQLSKEIYKM